MKKKGIASLFLLSSSLIFLISCTQQKTIPPEQAAHYLTDVYFHEKNKSHFTTHFKDAVFLRDQMKKNRLALQNQWKEQTAVLSSYLSVKERDELYTLFLKRAQNIATVDVETKKDKKNSATILYYISSIDTKRIRKYLTQEMDYQNWYSPENRENPTKLKKEIIKQVKEAINKGTLPLSKPKPISLQFERQGKQWVLADKQEKQFFSLYEDFVIERKEMKRIVETIQTIEKNIIDNDSQ